MAKLARRKVEVVCCNFMLVLDLARTDLAYAYPNGATRMRFDHLDFAMFDIHVLERENVAQDYNEEMREQAGCRFDECDDAI